MRILFITPYVPSLIRVRPFNFIKQLCKRHEVTLITLVQKSQVEADALDRMREHCVSVHGLRLSKSRSLISCCVRLLTPMPLQAAYTELPGARDLVSRVAESGSFDILHVEHIRGAHLAGRVNFLPRVYDSVDCITRLLKLRLEHQSGPLQRVLHYEELLKMRSYEPRVAASFDTVVITSEHDRRALAALIRRFVRARQNGTHAEPDSPARNALRRLIRSVMENWQDARLARLSDGAPARVAVVRNGVDSEYFRPTPAQVQPAGIVFVGKMSYFANASAALRFYREVFPYIRRRRPDAVFRIVGSDPPDAVRRLAADPAVEVTGYVPDVRPHLASSAVVICPIKVGVGIQNKVLEAMAMGKPVVATSAACGGIPDAVDGRHLIRADDGAHTAEAILGLLDNPEHGQKLGTRARRFVEERYSWDAAVRQLEEVYAQTVDARRSRLLARAL